MTSEILVFSFLFSDRHERISVKADNNIDKNIYYRTRKCTVLQVCVDTFLPGNFTDCCSEGVKLMTLLHLVNAKVSSE